MQPLLVGAALAVLHLGPGVPPCQDGGACRSELEGDEASAYPYERRGDRCEGMFRDPRGSAVASMELVAFVRGRPELKWEYFEDDRDEVVVSVPKGLPGATLRAVHARRGVFYRMDARVGEAGEFTWDTDVVRGAGIAFADTMVVASVPAGAREKALGIAQPVHLPVELRRAGTEPEVAEDRLALWFRPNLRTSEQSVQVLLVEEDGDTRIGDFEPTSRRGDSFGVELEASLLQPARLFQVKVTYRTDGSEPPSCDVFYVRTGEADQGGHPAEHDGQGG